MPKMHEKCSRCGQLLTPRAEDAPPHICPEIVDQAMARQSYKKIIFNLTGAYGAINRSVECVVDKNSMLYRDLRKLYADTGVLLQIYLRLQSELPLEIEEENEEKQG